jgi:hypothetical protein
LGGNKKEILTCAATLRSIETLCWVKCVEKERGVRVSVAWKAVEAAPDPFRS